MRTLRTLSAVALSAAALLSLAGPADAAPQISTLTTTLGGDTRPGGHPDVTTSFSLATETDGSGDEVPTASLSDVEVQLPPGIVGDPNATPRCTAAQLSDQSCPSTSQVGLATLDIGIAPFTRMSFPAPVYNVEPSPGDAATFAFQILGPTFPIHIGIRSTDHGLTATMRRLNRAARIFGTELTFWGVPADHNGATERKPFMRNTTSCDGDPLVTRMRAAAWEDRDDWTEAETTNPRPTGCDTVAFDPSVEVTTDTSRIDTPTGVTVDLEVPQSSDPDGQGSADLRRAVVTLPEGLTLNPGVGDGLRACSAAQFARTSSAASDCPDAARLGSATIDSPLTAEPLTGPIHLGPSEGGRYALYLEAAAPGVRLKLVGDVRSDPTTGRLTTTFDDNPELPFSRFRLRFDGGPRAALATPAACGTGETVAALTSWSASDALRRTATTPFDADGRGGACGPLPFTPHFAAGTTDPRAGQATALTVQLARDDRMQELGEIASVRLPAGLMANIGSVPLCSTPPACGEASRIGSVSVRSGAGEAPLPLAGAAYLTPGVKGAPWGMALTLRAVAGPIDLGTVVVRSAIRVGRDGRITVETDPLPRVLGGIPLRMRSVVLTLDRPGFMLNPTSCDPMEIGATIRSATGTPAERSSRFQAAGCGELPFAPRAQATAVRGPKKAAGLTVRLGQGAGEANMKAVVVELPKQLAVRVEALGGLCTAEQAAQDACPQAAQVGTATAATPILAEPLRGPVHLVASGGTLPKLVAQLRGPGFTLPLEGDTALTKGGRLRTTFAAVPDVPLRDFTLELAPTGNPVLQASALPCDGLQMAAGFTAQNGRQVARTVPIAVACSAAQRRPKVASKALSGRRVVLKLDVSGPGTLRISGKGVRTTTARTREAGRVTVRVPLSRSGTRTLRATKRLVTRLRVVYRPTRGAAATTTTKVALGARR